MKNAKLPAIALVISYIAMAAFVLTTAQELPERVAIHFGIDGRANGWASKSWHTGFALILPLGICGLLGGIVWLITRFPKAFPLNVPNREHWNAEENRAEARGMMARSMLWLCSIIIFFNGGLNWLTLAANKEKPPQLPLSAMTPVLIGFFVLLGCWVTGLFLQFRKR